MLARGHIILDGLTLTSDPAEYRREWPKRAASFPGLGGSVTRQEFGHFAKDMILRLRGGDGQLLDQATVVAIDGKFRTKGASYSYSDWNGLAATVFITDFLPAPTFLPDLDVAAGSLYTWELALQIATLTTLYGATYSGS